MLSYYSDHFLCSAQLAKSLTAHSHCVSRIQFPGLTQAVILSGSMKWLATSKTGTVGDGDGDCRKMAGVWLIGSWRAGQKDTFWLRVVCKGDLTVAQL